MPLNHQNTEQGMLSTPLLLWTIQEEGAWKRLDETGVLRADPDRVEPEFRAAYEWMADHLAQKVPPPPGCRFPLWAWYRWNGAARAKPDLRAAGHLPPGRRGVRIAFSMSPSQVLLSDFDAWHAVLNGVPFVPEGGDYDAAMNRFGELEGAERGKFLRSTWEGIFLPAVTQWPDDASIQAVFWELGRDQVREVTSFRAR